MSSFVLKGVSLVWAAPIAVCALFCLVPACSSSSNTTPSADAGGVDATPAGPAGGPVMGAADMHCKLGDGGMKVQETRTASCHPAPVDAGASDGGASPDTNPYGPTVFNAESDDDDCKYHTKWTASPIYQNTDVTFTLVGTVLADGKPLSGAAPYTEIFLDETHPAPPTKAATTETSPGSYTMGPVRFDKPGKWTVRFHVFGDCVDLNDDSPHGHIAFYVNVP